MSTKHHTKFYDGKHYNLADDRPLQDIQDEAKIIAYLRNVNVTVVSNWGHVFKYTPNDYQPEKPLGPEEF